MNRSIFASIAFAGALALCASAASASGAGTHAPTTAFKTAALSQSSSLQQLLAQLDLVAVQNCGAVPSHGYRENLDHFASAQSAYRSCVSTVKASTAVALLRPLYGEQIADSNPAEGITAAIAQ